MRSLALSLLCVAASCVDSTPEPAVSLEVDPDLCDWQPGDRSIVVADAVVTPKGIAMVCEQPGATAHSLLMFDPITRTKRSVYDTIPFEVRYLSLADANTLLLTGWRNELFIVDLTTGRFERILDYSSQGGRWLHEPSVIADDVYYVTTLATSKESHSIEKVKLHGGPDQTATTVAALPDLTMYMTASAATGIHVFGTPEDAFTVGHVDLGASSPAYVQMLERPRGPYEPMGFHRVVGGRVLWQDGARLVELDGTTMLDASLPMPLDYWARVFGDEVVQANEGLEGEAAGFFAIDAVDGTVRTAPLEYHFGYSHEVIGIVDDVVYSMRTDVDATRLVTSPLAE